jgi:hypothetical protein
MQVMEKHRSDTNWNELTTVLSVETWDDATIQEIIRNHLSVSNFPFQKQLESWNSVKYVPYLEEIRRRMTVERRSPSSDVTVQLLFCSFDLIDLLQQCCTAEVLLFPPDDLRWSTRTLPISTFFQDKSTEYDYLVRSFLERGDKPCPATGGTSGDLKKVGPTSSMVSLLFVCPF